MDEKLEILNQLLTQTFNDILKVEEQSLKLTTKEAVSVTEMHILDAVGLEGGRTVTELAVAARVTASTMTIAVNRLQAKGLVERERDGTDRRVVRVRLTPRARTLVGAHRRFHRRRARMVVEGLSPEESDVLVRAMSNLQGFFGGESDRNGNAGRFLTDDKTDE